MPGIVEVMRTSLSRALLEAVREAVQRGLLPDFPEVPGFIVEVPREKEHGDFAANLAMQLAKKLRLPPRKIAEALLSCLKLTGLPVLKAEVAGPGFLNFYLEPTWALAEIPRIISAGDDYGRVDVGKGKKVQVEFVSANPTGLLHMGNARGAALGDSLARILDFAGYRVEREFYINDAGHQIELFGRSLEARYFQLFGRPGEVPEEGYHGEDIVETVKGFAAAHGDKYLSVSEEERREALVSYALAEKLAAIRKALADFGVSYDVWFSETSLHESGAVREAVRRLEERGFLYEYEGALWFKAKEFGVEKDEVVIRKNGFPTYFAADIAYHVNKFERGFDLVVNIWGADHHGHVPRLKGALAALGYNPDALRVILMQLVRLFRGGEIVKMSKRSGQFVTLEELVEEVGRDAARYFFVMRSADSHLDFDLDLARAQSNENPVYYIQYAHARICSIFRQLEEMGGHPPGPGQADLLLLKEEAELLLARKLADFPEEVALAAQDYAPHRLTRYLHETAGLFHSFYNSYRVIGGDEGLSAARLLLAGATRIVLRNGLRLIGVSAPERM
ncbi:MAG: arginine--tRNA ligase [Desulfotomaculales bacterium]